MLHTIGLRTFLIFDQGRHIQGEPVQIKANATRADLRDHRGPQRVDVKFGSLLWIGVLRCTWLSLKAI